MNTRQLERVIERAERLDRGQFAAAIDARLDEFVLDPELGPPLARMLRDHIRFIPHMLTLMASWAHTAGVAGDLEPRLSWAARLVRQPGDDAGDGPGLFGLLETLWVVGTLFERCRQAGLSMPAGLDLDKSNRFSALLLGEDRVAALRTRLEAAATTRSWQAPEPIQAPASSLPAPHPAGPVVDRRLLGTWHHTSYYSSDDFSASSTISRLFGADGHYVEGSRSLVAMLHRNSSGNVVGQSQVDDVPADSRGRWSLEGRDLTLDADDGASYRYRIEIYPDSLLLSQPGREPLLWKR